MRQAGSVLVLLLYIMYVPFILAHTARPLLTDRSLLPASLNTYQVPLLFMAKMKSTCQSRSLLCVSFLIVPSSQLLNFVCWLETLFMSQLWQEDSENGFGSSSERLNAFIILPLVDACKSVGVLFQNKYRLVRLKLTGSLRVLEDKSTLKNQYTQK